MLKSLVAGIFMSLTSGPERAQDRHHKPHQKRIIMLTSSPCGSPHSNALRNRSSCTTSFSRSPGCLDGKDLALAAALDLAGAVGAVLEAELQLVRVPEQDSKTPSLFCMYSKRCIRKALGYKNPKQTIKGILMVKGYFLLPVTR